MTFAVSDDAPRAQLDPENPEVRGGQDLSIVADGVTPDGRPVEVVLHILNQKLYELEVWAGTWGDSPQTQLPGAATLKLRM